MITRKQLEIRYHSMLSKRLYYMRKLRLWSGTQKYDEYMAELDKVEIALRMFEWMLKQEGRK